MSKQPLRNVASMLIEDKDNHILSFTMEKEMDKKIPFLDVLIDNSQPQSPIPRIYRKKTFTGLLTNYFSLPHSITNLA